MTRQHRALRPVEVRVPDDGSRTFQAVVMRYGIVDDYDTIFDPGCFTASLEERMPRITWSHNWADPLGRYVDYTDTEDALTLVGEFDDFDAVPRARQAWAQLRSGTIDQFSVGFAPLSTYRDDDDRLHFKRAQLDEAALVLVGAVPGTALLDVRAATGGIREVPLETVLALAKKKAAGELDDAEAFAALELAAGVILADPDPDPPGGMTVDDATAAAMLDDAQAALDSAGL